MKVLNCYAGIGGNRKLWKNIDVTAIEINPDIAEVYQDFFPNDKVIVTDAHQYLLDHFSEFDFIWSSPPCQTHSSFRYNICVNLRGSKPEYPDMRLYQEVILLKYHCKTKWVVENVNPYYQELIRAQKIQRHFFWSNFFIHDTKFKEENLRVIQIPQLEQLHGFWLGKYGLRDRRQILRNCVLPELGLHVFNEAINIKQTELIHASPVSH